MNFLYTRFLWGRGSDRIILFGKPSISLSLESSLAFRDFLQTARLRGSLAQRRTQIGPHKVLIWLLKMFCLAQDENKLETHIVSFSFHLISQVRSSHGNSQVEQYISSWALISAVSICQCHGPLRTWNSCSPEVPTFRVHHLLPDANVLLLRLLLGSSPQRNSWESRVPCVSQASVVALMCMSLTANDVSHLSTCFGACVLVDPS